MKYCSSLREYKRRVTHEVKIGDVPMGAEHPIRVQSMTTVDTMDTEGSVEQVLRMVQSGCEYVRITAPSMKEAENLRAIKSELNKRGCFVPLVADIHFTPNAAELAAKIVEKVRVNPGNYADKKKFEEIEYTDASYDAELDRIREKFTPLVEICKEQGTAMRIGTNHGSLSDRIMSRYGDTAIGMVESALEFIRICEDLDYNELVVSMKSSNPQVMVYAYRLLAEKLEEEGLKSYPLHLGVTEAGEAEDGRIKSALGIGTLLEDGLGDTVRVSLTEEPEVEAPVGQILVDRLKSKESVKSILTDIDFSIYSPFEYQKRASHEIANFGGDNVPRVIADFSNIEDVQVKDLKTVGHFYLPELDKWTMNDLGADYIYAGPNPIGFMLPNGLKQILDFDTWLSFKSDLNNYPLIAVNQLDIEIESKLIFLKLTIDEITDGLVDHLINRPEICLILHSNEAFSMTEMRAAFIKLKSAVLLNPVVISRAYPELAEDSEMMFPATDIGGLLIDGFGDGAMLSTELLSNNRILLLEKVKSYNATVFGVLQAARTRITKTEYISCPSCGRTLFDLQETTAMIRKRTDHLKGVKIGIMGCIVNGPGEMADADFGYVGSGKGKITLYKGKEVMKRGVPSANALDELIDLIKEDGRWLEPQTVLS